MLHFPPFNQSRENNEILDLLKKYNVKTCVFGHIHSTFGQYKKQEKINQTNFYLTSCDLLKDKLEQIY